MTSLPEPAIDVSRLPTTVFGHRSPMWWGTLGFMVIEGSTLVICLVAYFYLRRNFASYPPPDNLPPGLGIPTVGMLLLLFSIAPMWLADRAARRGNLPRVRTWMVVSCLIGLACCVTRTAALHQLHVRWYDNAYGSAVWFTIGFHTVILLFEVVESIIFTGFLFRRPVESQMYSATSDNAAYWYFMALSWVPLYAALFVAPRLAAW